LREIKHGITAGRLTGSAGEEVAPYVSLVERMLKQRDEIVTDRIMAYLEALFTGGIVRR
jgi:hypothetical protein